MSPRRTRSKADAELAVEARGLTKTFPGGVEAVRGIDLEVHAGEIFGFLGPNGAGKSTTTRILTTLLKPTSGTASVLSLDVLRHANEVRQAIGVALQEAGLPTLATGREVLILQAELYGIPGGEARRRADALLEKVGLVDAAGRRVGTYSGGMKRRLDLATALIHDPRMLFLDEPTSGLDPASRQSIWEEVTTLNREDGITVFLTTQYLEEADRLCDRVAIIDHGAIVALGSPAKLKGSIGTDVVTVEVAQTKVATAKKKLQTLEGLTEMQVTGRELTLFVSDGSGTVARVVRALDQAKVPVESVTLSTPTLDEVFLRATGSRLEGAADGDGSGADEPAAAGRGRR